MAPPPPPIVTLSLSSNLNCTKLFTPLTIHDHLATLSKMPSMVTVSWIKGPANTCQVHVFAGQVFVRSSYRINLAFHRNMYPELHELFLVLLAYILTAITTKTAVFCEVTKCTLVEGSLLHTENRGNTFLRNVGKFPPDYKVI